MLFFKLWIKFILIISTSFCIIGISIFTMNYLLLHNPRITCIILGVLCILTLSALAAWDKLTSGENNG